MILTPIRLMFWISYLLVFVIIWLCRWDLTKVHGGYFDKFIGIGYFRFDSPAFVKDVEIRVGWWEIKRLK